MEAMFCDRFGMVLLRADAVLTVLSDRLQSTAAA